ncbi:MAG: DUF484 family protein [Gammaproteobacteria bacterium]|nr:DUF484 family protein [Gammaproteobacteria bacterium]
MSSEISSKESVNKDNVSKLDLPATLSMEQRMEEAAIAAYLREHPDFFTRNNDLLNELRLPHPTAHTRCRWLNANWLPCEIKTIVSNTAWPTLSRSAGKMTN